MTFELSRRDIFKVSGLMLGGLALENVVGCVKSFPKKDKRGTIEMHINKEKLFDTGKVKLNYLDYGYSSDDPLVMLHGGAWCWQEYLSLIPSLSQKWHICALDLRGNGGSGWISGQYRLKDFADDNIEFIKRLSAPAVIIGHSIGGVVALMVAEQSPEKVKALIIEDSPLTLENYKILIDKSRDMFRLWLEMKKSVQSKEELSLVLADKYKDYPGVTSTWILFFSGCLWRLDPTFFDVLLYDFDGFTRGYDYMRILAKTKCPILFIRGEKDLGAVMIDEEISFLQKNYPNVTCALIKGVGHLLHLEDRGQTPVLNEMLTFLGKLK